MRQVLYLLISARPDEGQISLATLHAWKLDVSSGGRSDLSLLNGTAAAVAACCCGWFDERADFEACRTSPITRASGKKKIVLARYVHNDRLVDALGQQAFAALKASPGARAYYDQQRAAA